MLSKAIVLDDNRKAARASRNRMDLLLIVNDLLKIGTHQAGHGQGGAMVDELQHHIEELVVLAAAGIFRKGSKLEGKLNAILRMWEVNRVFSHDRCEIICMKAAQALKQSQPRQPKGTASRAPSYTLPVIPRDIPWYELPASTMLEELYLHPDKAVDIKKLKVKTFASAIPSQKTKDLLDEYWETVEAMDWRATANETPGGFNYEYDNFGQTVRVNKITGEKKTMFNYYGWSIPWCEEIKEHGKPLCILDNREDVQERARMEADEKARKEAEEDAFRCEQERKREEARERERRANSGPYPAEDMSQNQYDSQRPPPVQNYPTQPSGYPPPPLAPGYRNPYQQPYQGGYGQPIPSFNNAPYGQGNFGYPQNGSPPSRGGPNFGRGGIGQGGNGWNRGGFNPNMRGRGRGGSGWS
ncbi:uncharacterized protein BDR25DRAFT_308133 [Lindgomyces ingoldianus]|uniref:Uncharacterized protein n=1 Tax=Lindgomyces ingoldianus TaxID=673940 RepID=A0ACB6Q7E1_9PLEO|nr:uncharacterized protein BDR25DRAFT_308133 [Lindgomyces ingoldianus]KAF2462754.1 hypothetical protein BDR25DRAFT_308133 [Lindgomyces ingoldianus]